MTPAYWICSNITRYVLLICCGVSRSNGSCAIYAGKGFGSSHLLDEVMELLDMVNVDGFPTAVIFCFKCFLANYCRAW